MRLAKAITHHLKSSTILSFLTKNLVYWLLRILFATYRLRVEYASGVAQPLNRQEGVYYFWHQQIISGMFFFYAMRSQGACIVSPSRDGKFAGYICSRLGFDVLYGSSFKSTVSVVRQALQELGENKRLCMVGDGSRGPALKLQPGVTYFAEKSDLPLIFVECTQQWSWTFTKSWDQFKIPLPFSTISVKVHQPIHVRPSSSS